MNKLRRHRFKRVVRNIKTAECSDRTVQYRQVSSTLQVQRYDHECKAEIGEVKV